MKDGPSLTGHVLTSLFFVATDDASRTSFARGRDYLAKVPLDPPTFAVYTAAEISWVLGFDGQHTRRQMEWIQFLRDRQMNERNRWVHMDESFGGWNYSPDIPTQPKISPNPRVPEGGNLSATLFALGAFRSAKVAADDPVYRDALVFVQRCQNFDTDDARFDDGGFFFAPYDTARNKAGVAGTDSRGRVRFHSYGSMTADGVRALLACGLPPDHPRVVAARDWLIKNFTVSNNPGQFERDREVIRDATYYYYCWSLAHAMTRLTITEIETPSGKIDWRAALSRELISRQRQDGSWTNRFSDTKEDDPLVATPFAVAALVICRDR
ncbi:MAG: terpene cyclase/mutase family protein [Anaerolineae bacterium]|nr:terpene cyclase/mutase family protein [Phycisphaerae bacterium]